VSLTEAWCERAVDWSLRREEGSAPERLEPPVSFQNNRPFTAMALLQPRAPVLASTLPRTSARTGAQPRAPRFLVDHKREFLDWWVLLEELCRPTRLHLYTTPVRLFRHVPVAKFRFMGRALTVSVLMHLSAILLLPYLPSQSFSRARSVEVAPIESRRIYYDLTIMDLSQKLPRIAIAGPGGHPGSDLKAGRLPVLGDTTAHPKIMIVLKPPRRDNATQTIYQSASAPDLRIPMDLKLPNVIVGTVAPPRPQIHFNSYESRPTQTRKSMIAEPAPTLAVSASSSPIPLSTLTSTEPHLPLPPPSLAEFSKGDEASAFADGQPLHGKEGSTLVIVGTDPTQAGPLLALPTGNRWAELSISPTGGAGSLGDSRAGTLNSRSSVAGSGGDASTGAGPGKSGGGAANSDGAVALNVIGGSGESLNAIDPMLPGNMIYAVPVSVLPRKNALVVSAGPMGGGGLDVYGALHCGKIYTVFLQMPGKSWTLQFCQAKHEAPTKAAPLGRSAVVRIEEGLLPPDPELRFDFRRLPLPPENAHKLILLKGLIREDGTVGLVQIYRSLLPPMDEAARLALSRWKFKPATRGGQPISVEILVGVPSDAPVMRAVH